MKSPAWRPSSHQKRNIMDEVRTAALTLGVCRRA